VYPPPVSAQQKLSEALADLETAHMLLAELASRCRRAERDGADDLTLMDMLCAFPRMSLRLDSLYETVLLAMRDRLREATGN
jgi:hypothetical protein